MPKRHSSISQTCIPDPLLADFKLQCNHSIKGAHNTKAYCSLPTQGRPKITPLCKVTISSKRFAWRNVCCKAKNNSESMCKREWVHNADDVSVPLDEHQDSGGEGDWRKELEQASWIYQLLPKHSPHMTILPSQSPHWLLQPSRAWLRASR